MLAFYEFQFPPRNNPWFNDILWLGNHVLLEASIAGVGGGVYRRQELLRIELNN